MRRVGRHYGLTIACPHCQARPGDDGNFIPPWNRWRWLSAHIVTRHSAQGGKLGVIEGGKIQAIAPRLAASSDK